MKVTKGQKYIYSADNRTYLVSRFDKLPSGTQIVLEVSDELYSGFLRYKLIDFKEDIKSEHWTLDIKHEKSRLFKKEMRKI